MPTRNIDQIFDLTKNALIAHGAAQWQADQVAKATAHSEAYGNVICGLQYVESYCIQLASGRVDGRADPIVTKPRASAVLSDAQLGLHNLHTPRGWKPPVTSRVKLALRFTLSATVTHAHRWVISRNRSQPMV